MRILFRLVAATLVISIIFAVPVAAHHRNDPESALYESYTKRLGTEHRRICEQRQTQLRSLMQKLVNDAQIQLDYFTDSARSVEVYYRSSGKRLNNFDQLVSNNTSAASDAKAALNQATNAIVVDCAGYPPDDVKAFKTRMQAVHDRLVTYRTTVKTFITAVKSVGTR